MVVWDTASGTPIKSILNPHPNGVLALDITPDALFVATLSAPLRTLVEGGEPQMLSLWEWAHPERKRAFVTSIIAEKDLQKVSENASSRVDILSVTLPLRNLQIGLVKSGQPQGNSREKSSLPGS